MSAAAMIVCILILAVMIFFGRDMLTTLLNFGTVSDLVREKINNYPVEKLESLILSVAKEHLRTIELFGALFGLIIGVVQSFIAYLKFIGIF